MCYNLDVLIESMHCIGRANRNILQCVTEIDSPKIGCLLHIMIDHDLFILVYYENCNKTFQNIHCNKCLVMNSFSGIGLIIVYARRLQSQARMLAIDKTFQVPCVGNTLSEDVRLQQWCVKGWQESQYIPF
jgi:hypothetical protein